MKLTRILIGTAGLLSATSQSYAANIYTGKDSKNDDPVYHVPVLSWSGFYVGGHLGTIDPARLCRED
jgi:hypothetical protein